MAISRASIVAAEVSAVGSVGLAVSLSIVSVVIVAMLVTASLIFCVYYRGSFQNGLELYYLGIHIVWLDFDVLVLHD